VCRSTGSRTGAGWRNVCQRCRSRGGDCRPRDIAAELGKQGIFVWDGNYYALAVTERLGVEGKGGMVRIGAVHYNTVEEIVRLGEALRAI
jgi:selenocysteine lyase/cysteine desulfurase